DLDLRAALEERVEARREEAHEVAVLEHEAALGVLHANGRDLRCEERIRREQLRIRQLELGLEDGHLADGDRGERVEETVRSRLQETAEDAVYEDETALGIGDHDTKKHRCTSCLLRCCKVKGIGWPCSSQR